MGIFILQILNTRYRAEQDLCVRAFVIDFAFAR